MTSKERIIEMIRKEFGLEDGVKFNLVDVKGDKRGWAPFYFENNQLRGAHRSLIHEDIFLNWDNIEVIKEPLLTEEEKEYLKVVIKASDCVVHRVSQVPCNDCMRIYYEKCNYNGDYSEDLPTTKYQFNGLEGDILYTPEELGLTEPLDQESKSKE